MNEILSLFREFTPGAWGVWSGVLMFAAWMLKEWRETRKLSLADRQARRDGYAKQVENLQAENRLLHTDQSNLRREYDDYRHLCQSETDALRQNIMRLEGELAGLRRRVDTQGIDMARGITSATDTATRSANAHRDRPHD